MPHQSRTGTLWLTKIEIEIERLGLPAAFIGGTAPACLLTRMSGKFDNVRYVNWLIINNPSHYQTGIGLATRRIIRDRDVTLSIYY